MASPDDYRATDCTDLFQTALTVFGVRAQMLVAMEELAELTQAISHYLRGREHNLEEEIADVLIVITQLQLLCDADKIGMFLGQKTRRLASMVEAALLEVPDADAR